MIQEEITYAQRAKMTKQTMFKILAVHKGYADTSFNVLFLLLKFLKSGIILK